MFGFDEGSREGFGFFLLGVVVVEDGKEVGAARFAAGGRVFLFGGGAESCSAAVGAVGAVGVERFLFGIE